MAVLKCKYIEEALKKYRNTLSVCFKMSILKQILSAVVIGTSSADMMLESVFENAEALKDYSQNSLHVEVANTKVRPFISNRVCLDFEAEVRSGQALNLLNNIRHH